MPNPTQIEHHARKSHAMTSLTHRALLLPALVLLGVGALAGCSGSPTSTALSSQPATTTVTASPSSTGPTNSPSAAPSTSAQPSTPETATGSGTTAGSGAADEGTGAAGRAPNAAAARCTTEHLSGSIAGQSGAAGTIHVDLELTNTGTADCTLQGWPGVSLVGSGNGTQIGNPAVEDKASAHDTVALKPGNTAVADLSWTQAGTQNPATCKPKAGDGFRVYPPGSKTSIFIAQSGVTGCVGKSVYLFTVGALH